jgi:diguanylate cyclase (GGDEF)-like protein/PAS domain S-box-containing protein
VQPPDPGPARPPGPGEAFFQILLEGHTDVIVVLGEDGVIRYATPSAAALFGPDPVVGARLPDLVGDAARADVADHVDDMLGRSSEEMGAEGIWTITGLHGHAVDVRVHSNDLRGTPAVGGLVLTLRDVTGQRQLEAELRRRATHDARTGLLKPERFEELAGHAVALARAAGTTAALMLVDLDDFKNVNDTLGHLAGNELLAAAAGRLAGAIRESDTAARYGGDEYAVLMENLPGPAAALGFAERVVQAFSDPFVLAKGQVTIGVSVGVATTADSVDVHQILSHADLAMYMAKNAGGQTCRAYDATTTGSMPAPGRARKRTAQITSRLDFPDPQPDVTGRPASQTTARPRNRPAGSQDRQHPRITP